MGIGYQQELLAIRLDQSAKASAALAVLCASPSGEPDKKYGQLTAAIRELEKCAKMLRVVKEGGAA